MEPGVFFFVLLLFSLSFQCSQCQTEPYCTSLLFTQLGRIDLQSMLYNCSNNIEGSLLPPSMFVSNVNGQFPPTIVKLAYSMNNLILIDNIQSQVILDFWFRLSWVDPRINLPPETWNYLNPNAMIEGINIVEYVYASNQLQIWLPDLIAFEEMDVQTVAELIRIFPNSSVFWSRHIVATLQESQMNLIRYPMDTQNITLTVQSFAYNTKFLTLEWLPNSHGVPTPISFTKDLATGNLFVDENQLWSYVGYTAKIEIDNSPIYFDPHRQFSTAAYTLTFKRTSYGIVMRLALPITIFMVIVGFTFWTDLDKRVDVTVNMLLVVSALYLVIGQVIPMVGYFTKMDNYITAVFLILTLTVAVHFWTIQLDKKSKKYPLNAFFRDLLVFLFRFLWVPFSSYAFLQFFQIERSGVMGTFIALAIFSILFTSSKITLLLKSFRLSILNLRIKQQSLLSGKTWKGGGGGENEEEDDKKACNNLTYLEWVFLYLCKGKFLHNIDEISQIKRIELFEDDTPSSSSSLPTESSSSSSSLPTTTHQSIELSSFNNSQLSSSQSSNNNNNNNHHYNSNNLKNNNKQETQFSPFTSISSSSSSSSTSSSSYHHHQQQQQQNQQKQQSKKSKNKSKTNDSDDEF